MYIHSTTEQLEHRTALCSSQTGRWHRSHAAFSFLSATRGHRTHRVCFFSVRALPPDTGAWSSRMASIETRKFRRRVGIASRTRKCGSTSPFISSFKKSRRIIFGFALLKLCKIIDLIHPWSSIPNQKRRGHRRVFLAVVYSCYMWLKRPTEVVILFESQTFNDASNSELYYT